MTKDIFDSLLNKFDQVYFKEKEHSYFINGKTAQYSATKLLKNWTPEFQAEKMANIVAKKQGFLPEDLLEKWNFEREYSCYKGTILHLYIENFLERKITTPDCNQIKEFLKKYNKEDILLEALEDISRHIKAFKEFYEWWKIDHVLIKSEFVIGDSACGGIGGTIDNLSYNTKTQKFCIFDYKTNKEVNIKNKYKEKLLPPFDHLDNCELVKYSLQLLIYRKIMQDVANIDIDIENCNIIWLSKNAEYKMYKILPLIKETNTIFNLSK